MSEEMIDQAAIYAWEAAPSRMAGCFRLWDEVPEAEKNEWRAIAKAVSAYNPNERLREALEEIAALKAALREAETEGAFIGQSSDVYAAERGLRIKRIAKEALSPLPQGEG